MSKDFIINSKVDIKLINKYKNILPEEILSIWCDYGFGTMLNGNLKIINPEEYQVIVRDTYFRGDIAIPIMITGFGDVIIWEKNEYLSIIRYKNGDYDIMMKKFKHFFNCINDVYFLEKYFELSSYEAAVKMYGELEFDECFGYVPLLGLGGNEDINNIDKVKIKVQIELISQLVGNIE